MFIFNDFVLQFFVLFFQKGDRVFVIILHLAMLGHYLINFEVFGIDNFFQFRVFIVKSLDLVQVLFFKVLNFAAEIIVKLTLQ